MRRRRSRRPRRARLRSGIVSALLLTVGGLIGAPSRAEAPDPPPYYAIRNVRAVLGTGEVRTGATVLLADGLIEAVGTNLPLPADAWVIDGTGLTLYPGLIDALTDLGARREEGSSPGGSPGRPGGGGGPRNEGPEIRGPEDRPGISPWVSAADGLGEDSRIESFREGGFTAAVTAPTDGYLPGAAALIHLGAGESRQRVLAASVAQRIQLDPKGGFRTFPGSLMGVFSLLRQTFSDARHYGVVEALYEKDPRGRRRPEYDRALAPLDEALERGLPFLIPAQLGREIDRALALRAENDLAAIVHGAQGAYARLDALKAAGVPVLVSLNWPEAEPDRAPESHEPFRTLAHRRLALTTPGALAAAGIPFAFTSDGLSSPEQIFENLRKALAAGLSEDDALAALTLSPARIFGVADRLGTIEKGKIANLVLASAPPWAEDVEIAAIFIDGRKYEPARDEAPSEPPGADVSGTWTLSLITPGGPREMTARLTMSSEGKVEGELVSPRGTRTVEDGRMAGELLRFKTRQTQGGESFEAAYSLSVRGESLRGSMSAGPMSMEITGERTVRAAEEQAGGSGEAGKVTVSDAEIREALALYQGPVRRLGTFAITHARVYTVRGETLDDGTVIVAGGKIRAVGRDLPVPPGVEVIDAGGGSLIPGILDAHSHIAVDGGVNEGTLNVTAMVGIEDVINPDDIALYRALAGGVTTANLLHGSANPVGGKNAVIKLRWGRDAAGLLFAGAPPGIKFALGENPKRSGGPGGSEPRFPATRMGVMDVIREAFRQARTYQEEWARYRAAEKAGRRPTPPRRDFKLEALVEILAGHRLVHSHCYRADEILQLLRLAEENGFRVATLQHALEGYKVADEIAAHGAGASIFSDWWGFKVEAYDAIPGNGALMTERGVVVSVNSDSAEEMRHLNQEAAKSMRWGGLDEVEALKLVTLNPALQLGIADRVGSIEVGKDADLVLYDGPPLALTSIVRKTFIDGDLYFDRDADRERQAKIEALQLRLEAETKSGGAGSEGSSTAAGPEPAWRTTVRWQNDETYTCREEH